MKRLCMGCMELVEDQFDICPHCGYVRGTGVEEAYYLEPGTILQERYLLGRVLGYGGFGVTYIGYDTSLRRKVAVKEYLPSDFATRKLGTKGLTIYSGDAYEQFMAGLTSFLREARNLANFSEVSEIVDIYDCFQENDTGYIVMEYLNGETVKELLEKKKKLPYEEAEKIICHVLDGLSTVHKEGIIHRDIAPDNIFITKDGEIKLLDFGAARYAVSIYSRSLSVILKPGYAPEEQYRSHGNQGPWTDIYGVGATFYRMITGIRPPESLERMVEDDLKKPSELGVEIPPEKEAVLMKSLEIRLENRLQSAEEFRKALTPKVPDRTQNDDEEEKKSGSRLPLKLGIACCVAGIVLVCLWFGKGLIHKEEPEAVSTVEGNIPVSETSNTLSKTPESEAKDTEKPIVQSGSEAAAQIGLDLEVSQITIGNYHSAAIKEDGSLWMWGRNGYGQLGDGTTESRTSPAQILTGVKSVDMGDTRSAAVREDGSLWMWGRNDHGELGDGTTEDKSSPEQILTGVKSVVLGAYHSAAIKSDGSLWMWGRNDHGELGDGTTEDKSSPEQILTEVKSVILGNNRSAAIRTDGSLWMWGSNWCGQLGDGTTEDRTSLVQIMTDVRTVRLGAYHNAAIRADGSLWMWGSNWCGQLGDGTTENRTSPVQIMTDVKNVRLGKNNRSAAVKADGSLWMWGWNWCGQLGDGTTENRTSPVQVMTDVKDVRLGNNERSMALKTDGSLWMWGWNGYGQLGDGTTEAQSAPIQIMTEVKSAKMGSYCSAAVKTDGSLWMWGWNGYGQLGDGTTEGRNVPVQITAGASSQ